MSGFIAVSRAFWDDPDFRNSEMSQREAFLWLVAEAAWRDRTKRVGSALVSLKRGQACHSVRFMAKAWGWSKTRVTRYLDMLENRDTLRTETGTGYTLITICNYDRYQSPEHGTGTVPGQQAGQHRDSTGTNPNQETNTTLLTREDIDRVSRLALEAGGKAMADPAKCPSVMVPSDILSWLKAGADLEADVLPAIRARSARASPGSIRSWAYFREPVMQAKARREAGIETPEFSNERTSDKSGNTARHRSAFADALREFGGGEGPGVDEPDAGDECPPMRVVDGGRA